MPVSVSTVALVTPSPTVPLSGEKALIDGGWMAVTETVVSLNCTNSMLTRVSVPSGEPLRRSVIVQLPLVFWTSL